jgi:hypothetical protein
MRGRQLIMAVVDEVSNSSPSLTSLVLLLIILFLSLRILGMLWRALVFWVSLAFKAAVGLSIAFLAVWIFTRGPEGFVEDLQDLGSHWMQEYEKYSRHSGLVQQWGAGISNLYQDNSRDSRKKRW